MAVAVFRDAKVLVGSYDMTGHLGSVSLEYGAEPLDATVFGSTTRKRVGGLKTVGFGYSGFYSDNQSTGGTGQTFGNIGTANIPVSIVPQDTGDGTLAYLFRSLHTSYELGGQVGELLGFTVQAEGDDLLARGVVLQDTTVAQSASTSAQTASDPFSIGTSTGKNVYAALHWLGSNASTYTYQLLVQSAAVSTGAFATRITFSDVQGNTPATEWGSLVGGTTEAWWRVRFAAQAAASSATFNSFVVTLAASTIT